MIPINTASSPTNSICCRTNSSMFQYLKPSSTTIIAEKDHKKILNKCFLAICSQICSRKKCSGTVAIIPNEITNKTANVIRFKSNLSFDNPSHPSGCRFIRIVRTMSHIEVLFTAAIRGSIYRTPLILKFYLLAQYARLLLTLSFFAIH